MTLRIEIQCYCEYKCTCSPIPGTKVTKQQIQYNLIRCNPALARYFQNKSNKSTYQDNITVPYYPPYQRHDPYKSIVDQKNLRILLSDKYPKPQSPKNQNNLKIQIDNFIEGYTQTSPRYEPKQKKQNHKQKIKKDPTEQQIREYYKQLKNTSRYLSDTGFRKYFNRQVFQNYGRQNTHGTNDGIIYGNYLKTHNINPHTGQNKPCDQQTFYHALISANPDKMLSPITKLSPNTKISANMMQSPNINLKTVFQQTGRNMSLSRLNQDLSKQKPMKKHQNHHDEIVKDNLHQQMKLKKYQHIKLSPKAKGQTQTKKNQVYKTLPNTLIVDQINKSRQKSQKSINKSPKSPIYTINSPKIQSQYVNTKQYIQPIVKNISSSSKNIVSKNKLSSNLNSQTNIVSNRKGQFINVSSNKQKQQQNVELEQKIIQVEKQNNLNKCPVTRIRQSHMEHILSKQCNKQQKNNIIKQNKPSSNNVNKVNSNKKYQPDIVFSPRSQNQCSCKHLGQGKCKFCLDIIKNQLAQKAQNDFDLKNRLITSARKATLYKNYSLNNVQNAKMNPHNY